MINYTVFIENPETKEVREFKGDWELWEDDPSGKDGLIFIWTDGNYSCNCNRALFFASVKSEKDPNVSCSCKPHWKIKLVHEDGEILVNDFE